MKGFSKIYPKLKPSIVAIASRVSRNQEFPDIIGTGFVARQDGIIMTNDHVVKSIKKLPRLKNSPLDQWPVVVLYFHWIPDKGMMPIPLDVKGVGTLGREKPVEGYNYGPDIPDLGFIYVHIKNLPALKIAEKLELKEGDEVAMVGFPMGTDALRAPGWLHQLTPTLQSGIVSAILPFPCNNPHAMLLNIMSQGGSSGSPILNPATGEVVGVGYGGIIEPKTITGRYGKLIYENNTSLTLAIPARIAHGIYKMIDKVEEFKNVDVSKFDTIETLISKKEVEIHSPKTPAMRPLKPEELLRKYRNEALE